MGKNLSKQHRASANGSTKGRDRYNKSRGRAGSSRENDRSKYMSCPDVVTTRVPSYDDDRPVNVTLYRSYGNVDEERERALRERIPEVRIYRRSTSSLPSAVVGSSRSLPRNFGRNAAAREQQRSGLDVPDGQPGTSTRSERGGGACVTDTWAAGRPLSTIPRRDPTTPSSTTTHSYSSILSDDRSRGTPIRSAISPAIPDMAELRRKLAIFERDFTRSLKAHFKELPHRILLSKTALAVGKTPEIEGVSLQGYLSLHVRLGDAVSPPIDLNHYSITAPTSLYETVRLAREKLYDNERLAKQIALDLVDAVAVEAAKELIRIYEYQIGLLGEEFSIGILARYAARCACRYVTDNRILLDRNTAIEGVLLSGNVHASDVEHMMFSVVIDGKEFKWYLTEMLCNPGIRKDYLYADDEEPEPTIYPWSFRARNVGKCDVTTYGYRGVHMEWDFSKRCYALWHGDAAYTEEIKVPGDIHQQYIPYRQLFDERLLKQYLEKHCQDSTPKITFSKYVSEVADSVNIENELMFVCRAREPCGKIPFQAATFDKVDMMRYSLTPELKDAKAMFSMTCACFCEFAGLRADCALNDTMTSFSFSNWYTKHPTAEVVRMSSSRHALLLFAAQGAERVLMTTGELCTRKDIKQDILDRMESFERSDAESADSLDALDTYTLTSFLGQNIVSKPQGRQRKRRLRHSTAGTGNNEPRTTNRGNIITARCRPQSTSALPPSSLAAGSKADTYPRSHNESDVWQRADIPPIEENTVSNHHTYSTPPPPPPPVVQMPASVSGSLPSVTNSPARMEGTNTMNGNHNGIHRPVIQQQHSLTHSSPSRSPYHQQTVLPPQQRNGGGHHASPAGSNHHGNFQQHPVPPVHVTETYSDHLPQYPPPGPQKVAPQTVPQKAPPPGQQRAPLYRKKSQTSPVHQTSPDHSNSFQYHRNEISSFQPKKPPRTFEATEDHREILLNTNISPTFPLLYGREHDLEEIYNRLEGEDRLVLITGAVGVGKSALSLAAGHQMAKQINCVTIGINGHGCNQTVHLAARLSRVIGLRYQTNQPELLCNWLASHSERIVFLFDNIDLPEREDSRLTSFMDMILQSADNVTFLCSSRRNFYYGGDFAATEFHLADQQEAAGEIFNNFLPALPAEAFSRLMRICNCNPLALKLVASALATGTVNQETLERGLDAIESNNSGSVYVDMDPSKLGESENDHKEAHILAFVAKVVASHLPTQTRQLLAVSSLFDAPVDAALLQRIMNHIGLLCTDVDIENSSFFQWDCTGTRVYIPDILKYVIRMGVFNIQELSNSFYSVMLSMISDICKDYHTKDPTQALNHFWLHYDTFYGAISTAIRSIDIATLASTLTYPTMCVYLHQTLESADYQLIFSLLKDIVEESVNDSTKGAVLSCLAYNNLDEGEYTEARGHSEAACNLQKGNDDRSGQVYLAFSLLCLGRACWKQGAHDQDTGLAMVKKSMDMFKKAIDLHCSMSMYAYEVYAGMHRERGSLMRARHYYNVIDFALGSVTEQMPFMQQGYNNRRSIWERMGLYAWAADAARKAAILADNVYSEHPLTADMFIKLCDCLMKTGDTRDALAAALNALRIRQRVLGRHLDTALAHKAAAYLLLRIGYFQEAVDHGIIALEICREVGAHERYSIDTETIIAQGQYRLRLASSFFVKLDTHEQPILRAQQASAAVTAISSAHASEVDFNLSGSSTQV